jgi:Ca2+-binding RTX toxin-like protein
MNYSREVLVIDPAIAGWEDIAAAAGQARVVVLDGAQDGLVQIAAALATERDLAALHIVSHGSAGQIVLGSTAVTAGVLAHYATELAAIGRSLAVAGDILLYGCEAGQGDVGAAFLERLSDYTGSDVAASTGLIGAAALGGNWRLDKHVGTIMAQPLAAPAFAGTLALVAGTVNNDRLNGTTAADSMSGGIGDDVLVGSAGNDTMDGGADGAYGDTVDYSAGTAGVTVNLGTGTAVDSWGNTDTLIGIEHITGTAYADTLIGSAGTNWFRPGKGNDTVNGGGGDDVVMYEGNSTTVTVDLKNGTAFGADIGTDTLMGIRNVHTGAGADVVQLSDLGGYVFARGGNDKLTGGAGSDNFIGGSGNDTINGGGGRDTADYWDDTFDNAGLAVKGGVTVNLATGVATDNWGTTDTLLNIEDVRGSRLADNITGNAVDNNLRGEDGNDTLSGDAGNDWLDGGTGADSVLGGLGFDQLTGGAGNDTLDGGADRDRVNYNNEYPSTGLTGKGVTVNLATGVATDNWGNTDKLVGIEEVTGSRFADVITGDANDNYLWGQEGNDSLAGGGGMDMLTGNSGNDTLDGGDGRDRANYSDDYGGPAITGKGVTVNLLTGVAIDNWGNTDTLVNIEDVNGSRYADTLTGNAADNSLWGGEGSDTLAGNDGNDWLDAGEGADSLLGGAGSDQLSGGAGNDTLDGGDGSDTVTYFNDYGNLAPTGKGVIVNLATGTATDNWGNTDKLVGIENASGSRYGDSLTGDAGNNSLYADEGNDTIVGGGGYDWLDGGAGADSLAGGADGDQLSGGAGNDTLDGGDGRDGANYSNDYGNITPTGKGVTVSLLTGVAIDNWGNTDKLVSIEDVQGSRYADNLTGNASDNSLYGNEGNDTLSGDAGNDWLDGGAGADSLLGGLGFDQLSGGAGNDTLDGGDGTDTANYANDYGNITPTGKGVTVNLLTGVATDNWGNADKLVAIENVQGSRYADSLTGNASDNSLWGMDGNDTLSGDAGNDWLDAGAGADSLLGGAGSDQLSGGAGNDTIDGGDGTDTVTYSNDYGDIAPTGKGVIVNLETATATDNWGNADTLAGIEHVAGSRYGDSITGNASDNSLWGNEGNDTLAGGAGNDWLDGGIGADSLQGGAGVDQLSGGAGNDTLDGGDGSDRLTYYSDYGSVPATGKGVVVDLATGTATDNWGNTDKLIAIEEVTGSRYGDSITGNASDNNLWGDDGNDTLAGGDGSDWLDGGNGSDVLQGGAGVDRFSGGTGNDTIDGGEGRDLVTYFNDYGNQPITGSGVKVNLATGVATDNWGHTDTLVSIEDVSGSRFGDKLTGNAADNYLTGGDGDDVLAGAGGADRLNGDAGADTLDGGSGIDTLSGGDGDDTYYVDNAGDIVIETNALASGGIDQVVTSVSYVLAANVEELTLLGGTINGTGNALDNLIVAGSGVNAIDGGAGIDTLSFETATTSGTAGVTLALGAAGVKTTAAGISGADTVINIENLIGSDYNDVLSGNAGVNVINGGEGVDVLDGMGGNDVLAGGAGSDVFAFTTALSGNVDRIEDFTKGEDKIRLENAIFTKLLTTGTLGAGNFKVIGSAALDADDFILYNKATGALYYDADGSGAGVAAQFAVVGVNLALANTDFTVV